MSQEKLSGGCLCGSVQYEVSGDPLKFYHCHCRRCRKATGTGHASNIILENVNFRWLQGEALARRYKVPEAERFANVFCTNCGSPLPRYMPETGRVVIPAGSLDSIPGIRPEARIFWDSRVEWSCSGDTLPVYAEYPG